MPTLSLIAFCRYSLPQRRIAAFTMPIFPPKGRIFSNFSGRFDDRRYVDR